MSLAGMYQEVILDHARSPHGRGLATPYDAEAHHVNPTCGDEITVRVRLDGDRVGGVSHDGLGCSISQASASVLTELVVGRTVTDALHVEERFSALVHGDAAVDDALEAEIGDAVAFAGVAHYPMRVKCALLGWMAWKDATARAVAARDAASDGSAEESRA